MHVKVRIEKTAGNYTAGTEFMVDHQIAQQLTADGIARIVQPARAAETSGPAASSPAEPKTPTARRGRKPRSTT